MIPLLLAGAVSIVVSLVGTPLLVRWLQANGIGQPILEELAHAHVVKTGTPTMGGITIVGSALAGYMAAHASTQIFTWGGIAAIFLMLASAATGLCDDLIKVRNERNLGLSKRAKSLGLVLSAGGFCFLAVRYANVRTNLSFTRYDNFDIPAMPTWLWVLWAFIIIYAITNGVNFADGLDGLAAGSSTFTLSAFAIIGFWQFRHLDVYAVTQALDLALVAIALAGGCVGFLWWNAPPAKIFMGDTGALGIGGGIAALGLLMNVQLLLPVITGLFVLIWMSNLIQIFSFRVFHKRVFRMAPLQHHFELIGWPETTIVVRFWILAGLCTAMALGLFYADFIAIGGID